MRVLRLVHLVEARDGGRESRLGRSRRPIERHLDLVGLAGITHIESNRQKLLGHGNTVGAQPLGACTSELGADLAERGNGRDVGFHESRACERVHHVRVEHSPGAERAGIAREDDAANADFVGRIAGVEAARAAEREQREILGIEPLFEEREANGAGHMRDRDAQNAFRRFLGCK